MSTAAKELATQTVAAMEARTNAVLLEMSKTRVRFLRDQIQAEEIKQAEYQRKIDAANEELDGERWDTANDI